MISIKNIILICSLAIVISGKAVLQASNEALLTGILPEEMVEFTKDLTPDDIRILTELSTMKLQIGSQNELIEIIREKSPELAVKMEKVMTGIMKKYDHLSPEAQDFIKELGARLQGLKSIQPKDYSMEEFKTFAKEFLPAYHKLSQQAKDDLKSVFPMFDYLSGIIPNVIDTTKLDN
uniref:Fatty-acid and retinol-binding protein 1 n=1 Tax=Parastrongyloides trichosuri TaxID=131310 RepID=A0A0N4ZW26_PARTI